MGGQLQSQLDYLVLKIKKELFRILFLSIKIKHANVDKPRDKEANFIRLTTDNHVIDSETNDKF